MNGKDLSFLRTEERVSVILKSLYKSYGYKEYKLPGFDEYSLYADNQNFFGGKDVVTFSAGGKLLALRPDVTLSIIKNGTFGGGTQKLFYGEKVYRKSARGGISEVGQIGVEIIGGVDEAAEAELCTLVLKTLSVAGSEIGKRFVLDISHTGIVSKVIGSMNLGGADAAFALRCIEGKNVHDFEKFALSKGLDEEKVNAFKTLFTACSSAADKRLCEINKVVDISDEIAEISTVTQYLGSENVNVDFSIGGDTEYYNGIIFKGYVENIPRAVLTGGRYDKLLNKFGKGGKAMGFALYLGEICRYADEADAQPDAVLLYGNANCLSALKQAEKLREKGIRLLLCKTAPEDFKGKIYYAENCDD